MRELKFRAKVDSMKLTVLKRLSICFEVLTIKSGHNHTAQVKQLSVFKYGYDCGMKDANIDKALAE